MYNTFFSENQEKAVGFGCFFLFAVTFSKISGFEV